MNILLLTDHLGHSAENSIYALARKIQARSDCQRVAVVSRSNAANAPFFYDNQAIELEACEVNPSFDFQVTGYQFINNTKTISLAEYDWIFLRLPRPIADSFFPFLCKSFSEARIINRPSGIEETSNKSFLLQIPEFCPPIRLCTRLDDIEDFRQHFAIVLKPLKEYGGRGILKIENNLVWEGNNPIPIDFQQFAMQYNTQDKQSYLAMKFLKNVSQGDKRIIVANGRIITAAMRFPPAGSWMCNVSQGGSSYSTEVDKQEKEIVESISPILLSKGIVLYGLDTLLNDENRRVISEINTLSVGGIAPSERNSGKPVVNEVVNEVFEYIYSV